MFTCGKNRLGMRVQLNGHINMVSIILQLPSRHLQEAKEALYQQKLST